MNSRDALDRKHSLTLERSSLNLIQGLPSTEANLITILRALLFSFRSLDRVRKSLVRKVPIPNEAEEMNESRAKGKEASLSRPFLKPSSSHCLCNWMHLSMSNESEKTICFCRKSTPTDSYIAIARGAKVNGSPES